MLSFTRALCFWKAVMVKKCTPIIWCSGEQATKGFCHAHCKVRPIPVLPYDFLVLPAPGPRPFF